MVVTITDISCMSTLTGPLDLPTCLNSVSGSLLWTMVMYAMLILLGVGWSQLWGISRGMMLGGMFTFFFAVGMWFLTLVNTLNVFVPLVVWVIGVILVVIDNNQS